MFKRYFCALLLLVTLTSCQHRSGSDAEPGTREDFQVNIGDHILFELNSARIDDSARAILDSQVRWLQQFEQIRVLIEGHCDTRGTREYNLALGAKRANAVKDYLTASGVAPSRVSTISYGKEKPPVKGTGPEVWKENRRATTVVN